MATVAKNTRRTVLTLGSPGAGPFSVGFRLFDDDGLDVFLDGVKTTDFTLSATYVAGYSDAATITLGSSQDAGTVITIESNLVPDREDDYSVSGPDLVANLDVELARIWASLSDLHRRVRRSAALLQVTEAAPFAPVADRFVKINATGDGFATGPSAGGIEDAAANATAAAASASAAAASAAAAAAAENSLLEWQGEWQTATVYAPSDIVRQSGSAYICLVAHTSGTFSTDLAASRWELFAQQGAAGAGSGDMLAANNLSDVANAAAALANLGAGSAATLTAGTSANNVVQLDGSARLPAVDGSQLTNLPASGSGWGYTSSPTTLAALSAYGSTFAHGLGAAPAKISVDMVCVTADGNWAPGDKIMNIAEGGVGNSNYGLNVAIESGNTTHVYVVTGGFFAVRNKTTGQLVNINFSRWQFIVKASL